jgi:hypothetical protein
MMDGLARIAASIPVKATVIATIMENVLKESAHAISAFLVIIVNTMIVARMLLAVVMVFVTPPHGVTLVNVLKPIVEGYVRPLLVVYKNFVVEKENAYMTVGANVILVIGVKPVNLVSVVRMIHVLIMEHVKMDNVFVIQVTEIGRVNMLYAEKMVNVVETVSAQTINTVLVMMVSMDGFVNSITVVM